MSNIHLTVVKQWPLTGIRKILGIIFVVAILGYAFVQSWVSGPIIAYLKAMGAIQ